MQATLDFTSSHQFMFYKTMKQEEEQIPLHKRRKYQQLKNKWIVCLFLYPYRIHTFRFGSEHREKEQAHYLSVCDNEDKSNIQNEWTEFLLVHTLTVSQHKVSKLSVYKHTKNSIPAWSRTVWKIISLTSEISWLSLQLNRVIFSFLWGACNTNTHAEMQADERRKNATDDSHMCPVLAISQAKWAVLPLAPNQNCTFPRALQAGTNPWWAVHIPLCHCPQKQGQPAAATPRWPHQPPVSTAGWQNSYASASLLHAEGMSSTSRCSASAR